MNKKIKIIAGIGLAVIMVMGLGACSGKGKDSAAEQDTSVDINVAAMSGPTGMGMAFLNEWSASGQSAYRYNITYAGAPDEITGGIISGEIQIAALPVNLASVLFNKTEGEVQIAAVNTLGVLYIVERDTAGTGENGASGDKSGLTDNGESSASGECAGSVNSLQDLEGRTIVASGKGSTPEYIFSYLLKSNGLESKVNVEYVEEHDEAITALTMGKTDLIMIPEPKVTAALMQVEGARIAVDLTKEWYKVDEDDLVQGVIVIRKDFAEEHPEIAETFLAEYEASVESVNADPETAAQLIEKYVILPKAQVALKALPHCNIVCITGDEMKESVTDMLETLFDANPASIGGKLPGEEIFFEGK